MPTSNYPPSLKCCIVGSCGVGKTSIIQKYLKKNNNNTETTLGAIFWTVNHKITNGLNYKIDFWDTAGQERYNSLIPMYSRNSDIMIIAFDISDRGTFLDVDRWLHTLTEKSVNSKLILLGNKCDMELYRQVYERDVKKYMKEQKNNGIEMTYLETSAQDGNNIDRLFEMIFEIADEKITNKNTKMVSINLDDGCDDLKSLRNNYNCCKLL